MFARAFLLLAALLLAGPLACSARASRAYDAAEVAYAPAADEEYSGAPMAMPSAKAAPRPAPAGGAAPSPQPAPPATSAPSAAVAEPAAARLVHYEGWARLRVGKLEESADRLVAIVTEVGGRVESLSNTRLVLRVPVDTFRERFAKVLEVGDVLDKTISAQDVTEAFQAVDLRLQVSRAARDRLQVLLAKARDEKEKLKLLREIQRLGEEIDQLEAQTRTLLDLASMSRITVELVPREANIAAGPVAETAEFAWIRQLSPFHDVVLAGGRRLPLDTPAGFVALDLKKRTVFMASDGARVRAARLSNEPEGSTRFWMDALQSRLAPEFASAKVVDVGAWQVIRLVDRGDRPYVYVLAVRADGRHLDLVEGYHPSAAEEERHGAALTAMLSGGAS